MITFSNLNVWDNKLKEFVIKDIEVSCANKFSIKKESVEGTSLYAIPPGIDIHVHFREPGYEYKETMSSGAEAALSGGILAVLDMPNTNPITDSVKTIKHKKEIAQSCKQIDIFVASAITNSNIKNLEKIDSYCDAYKIFMSESFGNLSINIDSIHKALTKLEELETEKAIIFHAENPLVLQNHKNEKKHQRQRPSEAEASAVQMILNYAADYSKLHFHITHLSSSLSLKILELAARQNLTLDTCPRYLWLDSSSDLKEHLLKVNPPVRDPSDRLELLRSFSTGLIEMISSDHSPHTLEEKKRDYLSGMPSVQELIPSVISLVKKNEIEWQRAIEAFNYFPKKILNLPQDYGDDSFIIMNPDELFIVDENWLKTKVGWSPFQNKKFYGKPQYIIKDSNLIMLHK